MFETLKPPRTGKTLCLSMIVLNESAVIERALASVRGIIDYWVIVDTGSIDATPALILHALAGIPGELHRRPWIHFGHNRTEALSLAQGKADYVLIMDADMIAHVHAPFKHRLTADAYEIRYEGDLDYSQPMLVSNSLDWTYVGPTHEFIYAADATMGATLPELTLCHLGDGGSRADKFERDVRLLTAALEQEPDNPRNVFYLAQSHKDLCNHAAALAAYEQRARMQGWEEERWYATYQAARMRHQLGEAWPAVERAYLDAYAARPSRLEPLYAVVQHHREQQSYALGYVYSAIAGHTYPYPADRLFIEKTVYRYLLPLEYGVCSFGVERWAEAIEAFNCILRQPELPAWVIDSALRGRTMALERIYRPIDAATVEPRRNRIIVFTPFRNAGEYLKRCIASLLDQDYGNFEVVCVDDASSDGCADAVPASDARFRLLRNSRRLGLAANLHRAILRHCQPEDIVVCLDGDDWLAAPGALSFIDDFYNRHDCWVMYGQFEFADGARGFSAPFASPRDLRNAREYFRASHIRTFRAGLFHRIADQDPDYECLKDDNGAWLESSVDAALMNALLELAGFDKVRFNERVLYVYNDENPANVHRGGRDSQERNYALLSRKRPFARIDSYMPAQVLTGSYAAS